MNMPSSPSRRGGSTWRFGLQSLLVLIGLLATLLAWWRDHRDLASQLDLQRMRLELMDEALRKATEPERGGGSFGAAREHPLDQDFSSLSDYLNWVQTSDDRHEVEESFVRLSRSPWRDESLPGLLNLLESGNPEHRRRAAYAFRQIHTTVDDVIPKLVPLLDDPEPEVQRCALIAIEEHGQAATAATASLRRHAESRTSPIAVDAILALGVIVPTLDIEADLASLLSHEQESVRIQAVRALPKHVEASQAEALLTQMFSRESPAVQTEVAQAINEVKIASAGSAGS